MRTYKHARLNLRVCKRLLFITNPSSKSTCSLEILYCGFSSLEDIFETKLYFQRWHAERKVLGPTRFLESKHVSQKIFFQRILDTVPNRRSSTIPYSICTLSKYCSITYILWFKRNEQETFVDCVILSQGQKQDG